MLLPIRNNGRPHSSRFWIPLILAFTFIPPLLSAQDKNRVSANIPVPRLKHLSIDDGLSQNYPLAIEQDSRGFMWFGTLNGLNKYDGYSFTVYTHDPYDSTTISGNAIALIREDSRGMLWIVTYLTNEINFMDTRTELFRKIPVSIPNISTIAEDKEGNMWIGSYSDGLFLIESKNIATSNFQFTHYEHQPDNPNSLNDNMVRSLAVDTDGVVWIGTDTGLDKLPAHGDKIFEHYSFNNNSTENIIDHGVWSMSNTSDSTLWLGTLLGLVRFNKINGNSSAYPHRIKLISYAYPPAIGNMVKGRDDILWMAAGGNLITFNVHDKTYNYLYNNPEYRTLGIAALCIDRAGNIWMGTNADGISIYFPESKRFKSFPNRLFKDQLPRSIRSIFEDSRKNLWFTSSATLFRWDRMMNELTSFGVPPNVNKMGNTWGTVILEDRNGYLWFETDHRLCRLSTKTYKGPQFIAEPHPNVGLSGILEDHSGDIWIVDDEYLSKLVDSQTGRFISYQYNTYRSIGGTTMMIQDEHGVIWFTSNMGLIKFDQESEKFTYYKNEPANRNSIYSNSTTCICPDPVAPEEKLWIGTNGGGLNLFDKRTETFTHILEKDGLPNNVVYGILPDNEGNLWLSTNKGLSKYNPVTKQFVNYDVHDGLQSNEFNTGAFFKSKSGEMFFGGINGFNYFYPEQITHKAATANIVFTDFKLFSKSVSVRDSNSILKRVISETDEITLSYKQNIVSFEFAVLDYYAPAKNRFAYKLEGLSDDWIQLGTERDVTFVGLNPGEYVLKVKGSNSDGIWSESAASIRIIITPPFWETWWAYSLYGVFVVGLVYGVRRYEQNRIHYKNQVRLDEVKLKERDETDKMKSRFFANISHEFRTPLTLILGPSENVLNNTEDEETRKQVGSIRRNASRLLNLVNQLLDLSKLEAGKLTLQASQGDIVSLVKGITMSFESSAETKETSLKVEAPSNIELYFDREKITKVMTNLLSNALKFTPEGGKITVTLEDHDEAVAIKVRDSGIGIPKEELPKLFDRFYQVDSSQTREHEGTGIGLALTKELVELHRGTISVDSSVGEWTEITVVLRKGREHLKDDEVSGAPGTEEQQIVVVERYEEASPEPRAKSTDNDRTVILIVEDNAEVRAYIRDSIGQGYRIEEAANGELGVKKAETLIPDLIISDVMMPKMDGNELTRRLKNDEKTCHIPIILLTAKSEQESKLEGLGTGADAYLTKPFDSKELLVIVKNLIDLRRKLRERFSIGQVLKPGDIAVTSLDDAFLKKAMSVVEEQLSNEDYGVADFAKAMNMGRTQLHRKLTALTNQSAGDFIRYMRLQRAKDLLLQNAGNVSEIAFRVGFNSVAYFTKCFHEQFGVVPSDLRSPKEHA